MSKSSSSADFTNFEYYQTVAAVFCFGEVKRVRRIWFDNDVVYDDRPEQAGWSGRPMTSDGRRPSLASYLVSENIEIYPGTQTQGVSPTLEALIGTADCPAFRGRGLIVFKDLPIHKFGGRLPGISIELEDADADANGKANLVDIINDIMDMAGNPDAGIPGIPSANRDLSQLAGIKVDGMVLGERTEARRHISPLQDAFMFDLVDVDYKLTAVLRGQASIGTIDVEHLGTGTPDPQPEPFTVVRGQQLEVPQRINIGYQSAAIDFQNFTQSTSREATQVRRSEEIQLPVVMSESAAMAVARKRLAMAQLHRDTWKVCLPMQYIGWSPGDVVTLPLPSGLDQDLKIVRQLIGLFGHIEFTMVADDQDIYTLTGDGAAPPNGGGGGVAESFAPVIYAADLPALVNSADASFDGCSIITVVGTPRIGWSGARVQNQDGIRDTSGVKQNTITTNTAKGTLGRLTATLEKWRGPNVWDDVNTITLKLSDVYGAVAEAVGTNTGDGIIVLQDPSTASGVLTGTYIVEFTSSSAFTVTDPTSASVGVGTVGTVFSTEIRFKITNGSTPFASGDRFNVSVVVVGSISANPPVGATDLEVLSGANILVCGGEVIQYASAIDLGGNTFELSRLLRGRRGTEHLAWDDHATGTMVAFITADTAQRFKAKLTESGRTVDLHAFDVGKTGADYTNTPKTSLLLEGNARKPWSPGAIELARSGDDLVVDWVYRSRWGEELEDGGTGVVPLGESTELYHVEVWDSTFTTLVRTIDTLTSPTWTYSDTDQATDFGSAPASPIGLKIYQISPLVGRGFPALVVVSI